MNDFASIPAALKERPQWVLWRFVDRDGEPTKVPFQANGKAAKSTDPTTWTTFDEVAKAFDPRRHAGLGFVFSRDDDLCGVDLDGCRDPQAGVIADWAKSWISALDSYSEVSPSGTGVKVFIRAKSPFASGKKIAVDAPMLGDKLPAVEVYDHGRYFAVTGERLTEVSPEVNARQEQVDALAEHFWPATSERIPAPTNSATSQTSVVGRARKYLAQMPPAISGSGGHNATFHAACVLVVDFALTHDEALALLREWNAGCQPPWSDHDLERKVREAEKQPGRRGRLRDALPETWDAIPVGEHRKARRSKSADSIADELVELALSRYRFGRTTADEPFAVERDGPNVARMIRGGDSLRSALAKAYRRETRKTPNASALADAMNVLIGEALETEAEPVALRVADHERGIVIDLGTADGKAVVVTADGWTVADRSPVLFRRTGLTAALPLPKRGGNLDELRSLLNLGNAQWPLLVGWLTATLLPDIAHPILLLGGVQGTGKSTALRMLSGLVDPSPAQLRTEPRDGEQWAMAAAGSWVVALDNVSTIPPWLSDALCKCVTGDGWIRRKLYTDSDVSVLSFRRVVGLTSIDAGALRGDLADRLLMIELEAIDDTRRRSEAEILAEWERLRPKLFGALLDSVALVLRNLPSVKLDRLPRMADFAKVLAALDSGGLPTYLHQHERLAADVVDGDPVALAIVALVDKVGPWTGTAKDLLAKITPENPPRGWPSSGRGMAGKLNRLIPALKAVGVIHQDHGRSTDSGRSRQFTLDREGGGTIVRNVQIVQKPSSAPDDADDLDDLPGNISADGEWGEVA